jgi:hypothetical protein
VFVCLFVCFKETGCEDVKWIYLTPGMFCEQDDEFLSSIKAGNLLTRWKILRVKTTWGPRYR